jgi:hypothetical protein
MNHSNKDGTSPAESGEERPLIKEKAGQPNTYKVIYIKQEIWRREWDSNPPENGISESCAE